MLFRSSQCAETQSTALGLVISLPIFLNPATNSFSSMAFIGLPCPRNSTGIFSVLPKGEVILFSSFNFITHLCTYGISEQRIKIYILSMPYSKYYPWLNNQFPFRTQINIAIYIACITGSRIWIDHHDHTFANVT